MTSNSSASSPDPHAREPIRRSNDWRDLRTLVLDGATSAPVGTADATYFDGLRTRVEQALDE
ncbi:type II toxin-antitoxin system ParD family antitoxin [Jiangella mangrovi]|uniref:Uncharacterized protein n=1 Tax=Jiangella mangrovi TaxID=1524084 RepID=A0A7W9LNN7_9ACTN|nr:type II toxin-antitoxin system ParD family antitoxin [Jiangella mangrovi]MBB5790466.1 hypothetical protein [Jiangella mangrovi]